MIKPNEIRIGNRFLVGERIVSVQSIHQQTMPNGATGKRDWHIYVSGLVDNDPHFCIYPYQLELIRLNRSIILKYGFEEMNVRGWVIANGSYFQNKEVPDFVITRDDSLDQCMFSWHRHFQDRPSSATTFEYLHELQNLFHVLTGKELSTSIPSLSNTPGVIK